MKQRQAVGFKGMQEEDNDNDFNQRASMMSMGAGRERRTALGRGTVSGASTGAGDDPSSEF